MKNKLNYTTVEVEMPFNYPTDATLVKLTDIDTKDRVRQHFDPVKLAELAESILTNGLVHPPTLSEDFSLVGGGRRIKAITEIIGCEYVPVMFMKDIKEVQVRELELEENFRREDFTWQEKALGIKALHDLRSRKRAKMGKKWRMADTGALLGLSGHAHVAHVLEIATHLIAKDEEILSAPHMTEAWNILLRRKEIEANAIAAKRYGAKTDAVAVDVTPKKLVKRTESGPVSLDLDLPTPAPTLTPAQVEKVIPLSQYFHHCDAIDFMRNLPDACVDHIVTDPPYAIETDNMSSKNITEMVSTHQVDENIELLANFISLAPRILRPGGFCIFWYDNVHWEFLYRAACSAGFKVQRWPVVWNKMHRCANKAGTFNFTKSTEFAMVCRLPNATLHKAAPTCHFQADGSIESKLYSNPFAKPSDAWKFLLEPIASPGQRIFDPFGGEFSCARTVINMGLEPLSCELTSERYNKGINDIRQLYTDIHRKVTFT